jgi:hypothetical protein
MGGNSVEEESRHLAVNIQEEDDGGGCLAQKMEKQMNMMINTPRLPSEPAVSDKCCIFELPQRFKKMNGKSYEAPQIVFIGPHHSRTGEHQNMGSMTEKLKWQCLKYALARSNSDFKRYIDSISPLLTEAKGYYSKMINPNDEFLEIMIVDGCFILECLGFTYFTCELGPILSKKEDWEGHPLVPIERVKLLQIYRDLLLLENQIPFFVLKKLFEISKMTLYSKESKDISLLFISARVFSRILGIRCYKDDSSRFQKHECLHLLHMVRSIFIQPGLDEAMRLDDEEILPLAYIPFNIPSISKLRRAGIKVKPRENDNFSEAVSFQHGVIEMPKIILNDLTCSFLVNCVAFEQCHRECSKYFSVYALLLDCLVNTAGDVDYLCDYGVIENYIETDAVSFINNLGKGVSFDWGYIHFFSLCYDVTGYYQNRLHRHWTSFKGEYFNKPWLWISAFVAFVLLVLTFLQTYSAMDPKH